MALSIFDEKSRQSNDGDLAKALGKTKQLWDELKKHVMEEYEPVTEEWKYYGQKYGWSLRLARKKRTILYLIPRKGLYLTAFVLGDRVVQAARKSKLPQSIIKIVNEAKRYGEGTGFRVPVKKRQELESMKKLAAIKMAN